MSSGSISGVLKVALDKQPPEYREALIAHLEGGTSANWLADWFKQAGTPVSATTIKAWRRSVAA